jgi:hypothetical protein
MDTHYHCIRECIERGRIVIDYINRGADHRHPHQGARSRPLPGVVC